MLQIAACCTVLDLPYTGLAIDAEKTILPISPERLLEFATPPAVLVFVLDNAPDLAIFVPNTSMPV